MTKRQLEKAVIAELTAIGFANQADFIRVVESEDGPVLEMIPTDRVEPEKLPALASVKRTGSTVEVKLHDKMRALELLGKHLGLFEAREEKRQTVAVKLGQAEPWSK